MWELQKKYPCLTVIHNVFDSGTVNVCALASVFMLYEAVGIDGALMIRTVAVIFLTSQWYWIHMCCTQNRNLVLCSVGDYMICVSYSYTHHVLQYIPAIKTDMFIMQTFSFCCNISVGNQNLYHNILACYVLESGLFVRHCCGGPQSPTMWIFKGPKEIMVGPSMKHFKSTWILLSQ